NFTSVHVPYTGAGKQAISQDDEIVDEIRNAIQEAARAMQRYVNSVVREREKEGKKKAIVKYIKQLSQDLAALSNYPSSEELEKMLQSIVERKYIAKEAENEEQESKEEKVAENEEKEEGSEE
ncbi:hypothetical protein KJ780_01370, partial [Candidatus Micrarchaeota archaeon]|nr:hypothetical protein [Candidatus Micrarchaeota archaeon]